MSKAKLLLFAMMMVLLVVACQARQVTDTGITIKSEVDPNLYTVVIKLEEPVGGTTQPNAQFIAVDGYARGVVWADGKGIVRGYLVSVEPDPNFVAVGDITVVKTTDWKVTGLLPGDTVTLVCIADFEPVCAKSTKSTEVGECVDMWEFDFCRLDSIEPLVIETPTVEAPATGR
ncbi:hypothetical protein KBC79_00925 [Candidatus Woesebacteria bacterium]|nr:hypothetical protein [Candidatus Woesebacteria bacterium]